MNKKNLDNTVVFDHEAFANLRLQDQQLWRRNTEGYPGSFLARWCPPTDHSADVPIPFVGWCVKRTGRKNYVGVRHTRNESGTTRHEGTERVAQNAGDRRNKTGREKKKGFFRIIWWKCERQSSSCVQRDTLNLGCSPYFSVTATCNYSSPCPSSAYCLRVLLYNTHIICAHWSLRFSFTYTTAWSQTYLIIRRDKGADIIDELGVQGG